MIELDGKTVYACTARLEARIMRLGPARQQEARARPRHRDRAAVGALSGAEAETRFYVVRTGSSTKDGRESGVVHGVGRDPDRVVAVPRQHRVAAVGVAGAAREVAAGHIDFDAAAGPERMADVAEADRHLIDAARFERQRPGRRIAVHRAHDAVHQQHRAPVRLQLDQLGDEIGVRAIRLHLQCHPHGAGDRQIGGQRLAAIDQAVIRQRLRRALIAAGRDRSACCARRRSGSGGAGRRR